MKVRMSKPVKVRCHPEGCDFCPQWQKCLHFKEKQQDLDEDYIKDENFVS